jgi:hypothetical protein
VKPVRVGGILHLYHHPLTQSASTIMEHVASFGLHSRHPVTPLNTELGFPRRLDELEFEVVLLHYSLFGKPPYRLDRRFIDYLDRVGSYRVAFFQDEYHYCRKRYDFLDRHRVGHVFTLLEPAWWDEVYRKRSRVTRLAFTLTGYVGESLLAKARAFSLPPEKRTVDVGYRGRTLPFHMGRGAREKSEIGRRFLELTRGSGLVTDIAAEEESRLYGDDWHRFMGTCRAVLGVEAGVSVFDPDDSVRLAVEEALSRNPHATFEEVAPLLAPREDRIFYRTVSPRHFEAAAFGTLQILFEGRYSGVMSPGVHYLPLKKDFSNLDEILRLFRDPSVRAEITANARRDLIDSGRWSYASFVAGFDASLENAGLSPTAPKTDQARISEMLEEDLPRRMTVARLRQAARVEFPGRRALGRLRRRVMRAVGRPLES